jgi:hypothetical protein
MKGRLASYCELSPGDDPERAVHWHPRLSSLADLDPNVRILARCRCGTWSYTAKEISEELALIREGAWEGIGTDRFVKVMDTGSGRIRRVPRGPAEALTDPSISIVGIAPGSERLRRPFLRATWVSVADTPRHGQNPRQV